MDEQRDAGGQPAEFGLPEPVAVALKYTKQNDELPQVVASGRGALAKAIVDIANQHGVAVREDADLASLLDMLEVGSDIPAEAFAAIAELLAFLYRVNSVTGRLMAPQA